MTDAIANVTRSIILLWIIRDKTIVDWKIIRRLLKSYGIHRGINYRRLLHMSRSEDDLAVYRLILELSLDDDEIIFVSSTAFQNEMGGVGSRAENSEKIYAEKENW